MGQCQDWKNPHVHSSWRVYSKTCVKWPLSKRPKIGFQDQLSLNTSQKYCRMLRMLQVELSTILSTFIKLLNVIKFFVCLLLSGCFTQVLLYIEFTNIVGERSGLVVECLTRDRRAAGSSLTGVTALWSLSKTHLS